MQSLAKKLFAPYGVARFLNEHWRRHEPFVMHAPIDRLAEVASQPALSSVAAFLDSNPPRLKGWLVKRGIQYAVKDLNATQARKLWETGDFTLVGDDVDRHVPIVADLLRSVREELGYTVDLGIHANLYMSHPGKGSRLHFDKTEVAILQVRGTKRWRYAANDLLRFPVDSYFGHVGPLLSKQLDGQTFPDAIPRPHQTVELTPGSVLFLPRGFWHETLTSDEESISITLTFTTQTWMDVVTALVAETLVRRSAFREPVSPVLDDSDHAAFVARFRTMTEEAHALVRQLDASVFALRFFEMERETRFERTRIPARRELNESGEVLIARDQVDAAFELAAPLGAWAETLLGLPGFQIGELLVDVAPEKIFDALRAVAWAEKVGIVRRAGLNATP